MGRICCARSSFRRTWAWPDREASDAFDLDFVDHILDARHVAHDPEDLIEDVSVANDRPIGDVAAEIVRLLGWD